MKIFVFKLHEGFVDSRTLFNKEENIIEIKEGKIFITCKNEEWECTWVHTDGIQEPLNFLRENESLFLIDLKTENGSEILDPLTFTECTRVGGVPLSKDIWIIALFKVNQNSKVKVGDKLVFDGQTIVEKHD